MVLHQKFLENSKLFFNKTAIYDQLSEKEYSYSRLLISSLILCAKVKHFKSKNIGLMLPATAGCMISTLALLMAGKTPVMINYSTMAQINAVYAQEKCNFKVILTSKKLLEKINVPKIDGMIFVEDIVNKLTIIDKLKALGRSKLPLKFLSGIVSNPKPDDNAVILFTSGSENDPKAVQLTHKNISDNIKNIHKVYKIDQNDVFITNLPLFHIFGLTVNFWLPITTGSKIIAVPNPLDYQTICESVKKHQVTLMVSTPTFLHGYSKKAKPGDFSSLRYIISGADKLPENIREVFVKNHGITVCEGYGTTETSPVISVNSPEENKFGSVGKPLPGTQVKICHMETGETLDIKKEGKILVKSDSVMKGYYGDIEETSLRIRDGWYDTGDMGIIDEDGFLWHRGRLKRFVKIGGEMISLVKVEKELEKLLPEGCLCCVVDVPNMIKGADIVAVVTTKKIDKHQILKHLKKKIPAIAIPKEFHVIEDIPMMPSGKVNFRGVEQICRDSRLTKKYEKL